MVPSAAETAAKAANFSAAHGPWAAAGGGEEGSPAEEEASEAVSAAAAMTGEEVATGAAGEAVEKENVDILGRRRDLAMRDMVLLA